MKNLFLVLSAVFLFTACKNSATTTESESDEAKTETAASDAYKGRYEFKSGVLETQTSMMQMGTANIKMTFDDYGKTQLTESAVSMDMMGKKINTLTKSLMKDGYIYTWAEPSMGAATKMKMSADKFDEKNMDFNALTEEMKKRFQIKEEGGETIDGKTCKVFSFTTEGMKGKTWVWKGVPLQSEMSVSGQTITSKFLRLEENPSLPASTFELPAGVTFNEVNLTEQSMN